MPLQCLMVWGVWKYPMPFALREVKRRERRAPGRFHLAAPSTILISSGVRP
jgi:hypothetical protein